MSEKEKMAALIVRTQMYGALGMSDEKRTDWKVGSFFVCVENDMFSHLDDQTVKTFLYYNIEKTVYCWSSLRSVRKLRGEASGGADFSIV